MYKFEDCEVTDCAHKKVDESSEANVIGSQVIKYPSEFKILTYAAELVLDILVKTYDDKVSA